MNKIMSITILSFVLTLLTSFHPSITARPTAKLLFQKKIDQKGRCKYKVKKGDNIYSILRKLYRQLPTEDMSLMTERIKKLNPGLKDINFIYPGQSLNLPQASPNSKGKLLAEFTQEAKETKDQTNRIKSIIYTVKSGDHLYKILRHNGNLTNEQINSTYLYLFKELNPGIKDINNLQVGQEIVLPLPVAQDTSKQEQTQVVDRQKKKSIKNKITKPKQKSLSKQEERKILAKSLLRTLGFTFASGKEMIYPYGQKEWCHINLQKTPLASSPWGEPTIFLPQGMTLESELTKFRQANLQICPVAPSWSLDSLLTQIEELFANKLIYWQGKHKLILHHSRQIFELQADYQVIVKYSSTKSFYLFNLSPCAESCPSPLTYGYLANQNIFIYESGRSLSNTHFRPQEYPKSDSLYLPKVSPSKIEQLVSSRLHNKDLTKYRHLYNNTESFLCKLTELQLASREAIKLSWGPKQKISLNLKLFKVAGIEEDYYLLPPKQANPYLVALLRLKGYNCFVVCNDNTI